MTLPVPLGVRLYSIITDGGRWVTKWVDDISFRSVVPGGFASATITLRIPRNAALPSPDARGYNPLTELFTRVQIVDLRTCEVAWEGRIEDPARQVEPDTWQIGALGSMVVATDVQRPVFYIDSSIENWIPSENMGTNGLFGDDPNGQWSTAKDDASLAIRTTFNTTGAADSAFKVYSWRWDSHGFDQPIARFTTTHDGNTSNAGAPSSTIQMILGIASSFAIDVTTFASAEVTKSNVIGTDFTDANTRYIMFGITASTGFYAPSAGEVMYQKLRNPKVLGLRLNRSGAKLITAANYPNDYVTVAQVVEDVVGRFLVGGWYDGALNVPWPGSVRSSDVFIDASNTTQILHLTYPDGATAADILTDLITKVQPNAYWAIWESDWGANDSNDFPAAAGFRFEYATWPNNWGYVASSQDGFEGQPNGDDVWNFLFYRYQDTGDNNRPHVIRSWQGDEMAPELYNGGFTRALTVNKQDPTDATTGFSLAPSTLAGKRKVLNAGTLTVRRPIYFFDAGVNSGGGGSRMLDPWMIRPGKLLRLTDLPPRVYERDLSSGTTLPSSNIDGTLFRVVATEYNSSDNSCRLELDQVTRWQVPTQINEGGAGPSKTIRIQ